MDNHERRAMVKGYNNPNQGNSPLPMSGDDFHDELSRQIIGEEEEYEPINVLPDTTQTQQPIPDNNGEIAKRLENLERRYTSSSTEGMRLAEENRKLAEENARLQAEPKNKPPKNLKEALGLNEDFVYDEQEAIDDPDSDSYRYRKAEIALEAKRIIDSERQKDSAEIEQIERDRQKAELMQEFQMDEQGWNEFENSVKGRQWSLRDIFVLQHPEVIANTAIQEISQEQRRHLEKIGNFGKTLAHTGGGTRQNGLSGDQIFDSMFVIDNSKFVTKDEI